MNDGKLLAKLACDVAIEPELSITHKISIFVLYWAEFCVKVEESAKSEYVLDPLLQPVIKQVSPITAQIAFVRIILPPKSCELSMNSLIYLMTLSKGRRRTTRLAVIY